MGMFTQNEILLMIGIVSILLISITILTIFDIKEYLKNKKNGFIDEEDKSYELSSIKDLTKEETKIDDSSIVEVMEVDDNDEMVISDFESDVIKDEVLTSSQSNDDLFVEEGEVVLPEVSINPIQEEPISVQVNETNQNINLQEEFDKALNEIPNEENAIEKFEEEQERTAIISLDELMAKSDELYNNNEFVQYDDGNEPISIDEIMNKFQKSEEKEEQVAVPEVMADIVEEKRAPYSRKETIPFISSVYGIEKNNNLEFENTATYEKLSRSTNSDFVTRLREMNENK